MALLGYWFFCCFFSLCRQKNCSRVSACRCLYRHLQYRHIGTFFNIGISAIGKHFQCRYCRYLNSSIMEISAYRQSPISAYWHISKNVISARPYSRLQSKYSTGACPYGSPSRKKKLLIYRYLTLTLTTGLSPKRAVCRSITQLPLSNYFGGPFRRRAV